MDANAVPFDFVTVLISDSPCCASPVASVCIAVEVNGVLDFFLNDVAIFSQKPLHRNFQTSPVSNGSRSMKCSHS